MNCRMPIIICSVLTLSVVAQNAEAFRCKGKIISPGMNFKQVVELCGGPHEKRNYTALVEQSCAVRSSRSFCASGAEGARDKIEVEHKEVVITPVAVDEWVYNLDRGHFVRLLIFEEQLLHSIATLKRGSWYQEQGKTVLESTRRYIPTPRLTTMCGER